MPDYNDKAFVELQFNDENKKLIDVFVKSIVPEDMLYYSPEAEHIRGNMSKALHCTLYFGLHPSVVDNDELKEIIEKLKTRELELGALFYFNGYENLYKVLSIEVLDQDQELEILNSEIEEFAQMNRRYKRKRVFQPHLTLAYVKNEYELPENIPNKPTKIEFERIAISTVLEFNSKVNS